MCENKYIDLNKYDFEKRKLAFQLVPKTSWGKNLRSLLSSDAWDWLSNDIRVIEKCNICGEHKNRNDLHAHEIWRFDDSTHIQYLIDIIPVCECCHNAIHIGYANTQGKGAFALDYYKKINNLTDEEVAQDYKQAFEVWNTRSLFEWKLEPDIIEKAQTFIGFPLDFEEDGRYYASIRYEDKEDAKLYGAKWDWKCKRWYFTTEQLRKNWYLSRL